MSLRLSILLLAFAVHTAHAQTAPALVTDRPDQTESAVTMLPGWIQFESGVTYSDARALSPALLTRVGVVPGLEVRLGAGADDFAAVVETVTLGGKLRLWSHLGGTEGALLVTTAFNTDGVFEQVETRLSLATVLTAGLGLGVNAGTVWNQAEERLSVLYTLALGFDLSERAGAFAEFYGEDEFPAIDAGLTFLVAPNVQLDVAGGHALGRGGYFVGAGVSYRLPR